MMTAWNSIDGGRSLGTTGSEAGTIILDDEHPDGARVTIERGGTIAPFSITCGVYGWMAHTRFFSSESEARQACIEMKEALVQLMGKLEDAADERAAGECCAEFIRRFP